MRDINKIPMRPDLAVTPPRWEAHHYITSDQTHVSEIEIYSGPAPGEPEFVWDPDSKSEVPNHGTLLFKRDARIQRVATHDRELAVGGVERAYRRYQISLSADVPNIVSSNRLRIVPGADSQIDGKFLSIVDVQGGSLRMERILLCLDNLE